MQFFERQEAQRSYTRWLVAAFITALLLVTALITLVIVVGVAGNPLQAARYSPGAVAAVALVVVGVMLVASWHRSSQLRAGGAVVARSLGGVPVTAADSDFKRKRLLNIVEEMAIAARIRKPHVYVLTEEPGINAFAAGNSPDEAAVVVTQGALETLDREQLQAVIGHEFSHVLNGDMRINMRLTAWIFGLFVLTDIATRIMRSSGRGKNAARVKAIALGIFIAGSIGLVAGRLLQAAVSRRREHLADASAVQFTRNPQALQGAFIAMAAHPEGSKLHHTAAFEVAHMLFAHSDAAWAQKAGTTWFSTHPPLEERVQAIDPRISSVKFRSMVSDERRKIATRVAQAAAGGVPEGESPAVTGGVPAAAAATAPASLASVAAAQASAATTPIPALTEPMAAMPMAGGAEPAFAPGMPMVDPLATAALAAAPAPLAATARQASTASLPEDERSLALAETPPSGIRMVAGRSIPPDVLRNRLSVEQQASITHFLAAVESSDLTVQATFVASMLAEEPAKWRTQLTRLAPLLGAELMKATQAQIARVAALAPAARAPMLVDLTLALDGMDPADRKRLRAIARAFASTVATGDTLRFAVTRILEKKLAKAIDAPPPVPLPEQAVAVCELYVALAQCRFGAGKQGQNAYRAGLMGMLPPQKWSPYPDALVTPAALDTAMAAVAQVHPTGKRSFSEGMARVIAVGGRLTVPQVDLLRTICVVVDCAVPPLPVDVVYEEADTGPQAHQASAR